MKLLSTHFKFAMLVGALSANVVCKTAAFCPSSTNTIKLTTPSFVQTSQRRLPSVNKQILAKPTNPWHLNASLDTQDRYAEDNRPKERGQQQEQDAPWLVQFASSRVGAVAILALVILFHESGHYLTAKSLGVAVDEFSIGLGPKLAGFSAVGNAFNLRALPLGGFVSINRAAMEATPWFSQIFVLSAGVLFNLLLAFLIYTGDIMFGKGLVIDAFEPGIVVASLDKKSPARGLLKRGDVIDAVNGKTLLKKRTTSEMEANRATSKLIREVQNTPDGQKIIFTIMDPNTNNARNVEVYPRRNEVGKQTVGAFLQPNYVGTNLQKTDNPLEATSLAASYAATLTKETVIGLATFTGDVLSGNAGSSEYRVSGPIKVIERASDVVKTRDWDTVVKYAAAVSINLGVINCFPIPPSDGFQILFTAGQALLHHT